MSTSAQNLKCQGGVKILCECRTLTWMRLELSKKVGVIVVLRKL